MKGNFCDFQITIQCQTNDAISCSLENEIDAFSQKIYILIFVCTRVCEHFKKKVLISILFISVIFDISSL